MLSEEKRKISTLVPYKQKNGILYFFLQKRSENAKRLPGMFGLWGGGANQGESPEEAMLREIQEELTIKPDNYRFFNHYEFLKVINDLFIVKVGEDFESKIIVNEGEYGKFFSLEEALNKPEINDANKLELKQIHDFLIGKLDINPSK